MGIILLIGTFVLGKNRKQTERTPTYFPTYFCCPFDKALK